MQSAEINLLDRSVFAAGVPHAWFTHLRANDPVFFHSEPHGPGFRTLDAAIAAGGCDFVTDVAMRLPVDVIAEPMGVPPEDSAKIGAWTNQILGSEDPEYFVGKDQMAKAIMAMGLYVYRLCEQRRRDPRDDIMSELVTAELDGDG